MRGPDIREEARRAMVVCNACRYCEGYCAVFPAMELRRAFSDGELDYLANLCHNCRGCYYACQYAPPHEFGINLPRTFAELRMETYADYAWPQPLAKAFARNGLVVSLLTTLVITLVLAATMLLRPPEMIFGVHEGPGSFYRLIPYGVMVAVAGTTFGFALFAMGMGVVRFWRGTGGGGVPGFGAWARGLSDVLTLRNLGGGGHGCNDLDQRFSTIRRRFHHMLFYGFMFCVASTTAAAIYDHFLHLVAPYSLLSWPVVLGTIGGIGMVVGASGLLGLKLFADDAPSAERLLGADIALLVLLGGGALTGLMLLALRETAAMGMLLAIHLGFVFALFLVMPYSRFVHGVYRMAALVRNAVEQTSGMPSSPSDGLQNTPKAREVASAG